jgi:hypothetical protein
VPLETSPTSYPLNRPPLCSATKLLVPRPTLFAWSRRAGHGIGALLKRKDEELLVFFA